MDPDLKLPTVAIIGRPNVGKSSLLNAIIGRRVSITDPTPGVTRDRVSVTVLHGDHAFELVDTGGIGLVDEQKLEAHVEAQIDYAMRNADVVIFLVDAQEGPQALDARVTAALRKVVDVKRKVVLAANKCDSQRHENQIGEFYKLGMGEVIPISAEQKLNIRELLDHVTALLPPPTVKLELSDLQDGIKVAIVGKMNAGKSTLTNYLAGDERVIVSDIPGTTRDAVDVPFTFQGNKFVAIDTAGLRRRQGLGNSIELFSQARSEKAIRRADVVLFLIDAKVPVSMVDKKLAKFIAYEYKPCIICVNKWDLAGDTDPEKFHDYISKTLPALYYAPITFITARDGRNVSETLQLAAELHEQSRIRVPTPRLNEALQQATRARIPKVRKVSRPPKVYYCLQVEVSPPTMLFFVNDPKLFDDGYRRYLENFLRKTFDFEEIPVRMVFKEREQKPRKPGGAAAGKSKSKGKGKGKGVSPDESPDEPEDAELPDAAEIPEEFVEDSEAEAME